MIFSAFLLLVTLIIYHQISFSNAQNASIKKETQIPSFFIPKTQERIVAIGDLHGEWDQSIKVMRSAKLIDNDNHWIGGKTIFVQMGDLMDRGKYVRQLFDLMMRLEKEAEAAGGKVIVLLGNHEVNNLLGKYDVPKYRKKFIAEDDMISLGGVPGRRLALSADGVYGGWLRKLPLVVQIEKTVFVHGGLTSNWAAEGVDKINRASHRYLNQPIYTQEILQNTTLLGDTKLSPTWYRGLVNGKNCQEIEKILKLLNADRIIVGHTVQKTGKILTKCPKKLHGKVEPTLYDIDVGIWRKMTQGCSAIEIIKQNGQSVVKKIECETKKSVPTTVKRH